jgi:hypothetical protein
MTQEPRVHVAVVPPMVEATVGIVGHRLALQQVRSVLWPPCGATKRFWRRPHLSTVEAVPWLRRRAVIVQICMPLAVWGMLQIVTRLIGIWERLTYDRIRSVSIVSALNQLPAHIAIRDERLDGTVLHVRTASHKVPSKDERDTTEVAGSDSC